MFIATEGADRLGEGPVVGSSFPTMRRRRSVEPVLGSRLSLLVDVEHEDLAEGVEAAVVQAADRLEANLSVHRSESPSVVGRRGELAPPPMEVVAALRLATEWFVRSSGGSTRASAR